MSKSPDPLDDPVRVGAICGSLRDGSYTRMAVEIALQGGAMGGLNALNSLRTVGRAMHAWVVPEQATVPKAWQLFDDNGNIKDEAIEKRLRNVGRQVARFAYLHGSRRAQEFLRLWEDAPANPGA